MTDGPPQPLDASRQLLNRAIAIAVAAGIACGSPSRDPELERALALTAAQDTARRQWQHEVGVDSAQARGDTTVVWVSPRKWMATDAPQAVIRVHTGGRILGIRWIMGG